VIVQSRRQQDMLQEGFGRDSVIIPMPCPGPSEDEYAACAKDRNGPNRILWIGRICEVKRPDRLLDMAESCSDLEFDLVGPSDGSTYSQDVCRRAEGIGNVRLCGPASRERVSEFYQKAAVLCCTSDFEGFPNTFLEAWSYGLPIVSTVDPDGLISEKGLGTVGENASELVAGIRKLLDSQEKWKQASRLSREYYLENHSMDKAMRRFEKVFLDVVAMQSPTII